MNLQELLTPIAKATETSFELFLVPISGIVNWLCIGLAFVGIFLWMKMQSKYNSEASKQGSIH